MDTVRSKYEKPRVSIIHLRRNISENHEKYRRQGEREKKENFTIHVETVNQ